MAALQSYGVMDTEPEAGFDDVVRLAALICGTPTALVSLVDGDRQWFKARVGMEACSTEREAAFCTHALRLAHGEVLEVEDARSDHRFATNRLVTGDPFIRFYAGAPLVASGGFVLGTLCVIDTVARRLTDGQRDSLAALARQVVAQLELRRQTRMLAGRVASQEAAEAELLSAQHELLARQAFSDAVLANVASGIVACDASGHITLFNATSRAWHGVDADVALDPAVLAERYDLFEADGVTPLVEERIPVLRALYDGEVHDAELVIAPHGLPATRVLCSGRQLRGPDGQVSGALVAMHDITALARREREAAKLSSYLEAVLAAATEHSVIATEPEGLVVTFSEGAERMLGYRAAEMVGMAAWEVIHDRREVADRARQAGAGPGADVLVGAARSGDHETREWTYLHRDGRRIPARLTVTAMRDQDGTIVGFIHIATDITVEKAAVGAVRAAEERWRVLLDHLPDTSVLVVDDELRFQVAVGAGLDLQGMADIAGKTVFETSSPPNVETLVPAIRSALDGHDKTVNLVSTNGRVATEITATPLPIKAGDARREALVVARDVSTATARENQLRAAEERARRLFEDAPHGIVVFASDGTVLQANPAMADMLGRSVDYLAGRRPGADGNPSTISDVVARVVASATGQLAGEVQLHHADGRVIDVAFDSRLLPGVEGAVDEILVNAVDVSDRRRYEAQLAHLADHDPLTGLANRRRFDTELAGHLARCKRHGPHGAVMMIDLDHFKLINDTLGHGAGDQLIMSVANLLRHRLRATDLVARLGGDEFAVLLPEADQDAAEAVAADIVDRIRETPVLDGTRPRRITASIGLVLINRPDISPTELMSTADLTMYDAKDAGRDQYSFLDTVNYHQPRRRTQMAWADRIDDALASDGFELHAQPILDLTTGTVRGAELLLRMIGEGGERILPNRFLPIAERLGLVTRIDTWVADRAIDLLEDIHRSDPTFRLEVNLSGLSVGNAHLAGHLVERVRVAAIDPRQLVFEITETAAIASVDTARQFARSVAEAGCRFALDDFGAGFGSFYYLKHLPFDYVKIDGEFVTKCVTNQTDRVILTAIVGIARGLGKETIAEYVSGVDILDTVRDVGVDHAQGFHIGRPIPVDQFLRERWTPSEPVGTGRSWAPTRV